MRLFFYTFLLPFTACALDIVSMDPAVNARFTTGFPDAPEANASAAFVAHGIDLSGLGWVQREPTHPATLVTPDCAVYADHQPMQVGDTIVFAAADGSVKTGQVASVSRARLADGTDSDLGIARFTAPVAGVAPLAVGTFAQPEDLLSYPVFLSGHGPDTLLIGTNEVVDVVVTGKTNPTFKYLSEGRITGMANGQSGDSGGPSFVVKDGQPILLGVHLEVDQDTFISPLVPSLRSIVGSELKTIPLPPGR